MRPEEPIGEAEQRYLRAICDLAAGEAKAPVSFHEVQEFLSYTDGEASHCCEFWTDREALEWPILGHIALTHLGLAQAKRNGNGGTGSSGVELMPCRYEPGPDQGNDHRGADRGSVSVVIPVLNEAMTIEQ